MNSIGFLVVNALTVMELAKRRTMMSEWIVEQYFCHDIGVTMYMVSDIDNDIVIFETEEKKDAEQIVREHNAHEKMVKALEIYASKKFWSVMPDYEDVITIMAGKDRGKIALAALAAAKGDKIDAPNN
jgi:hypothetical protein